MQDYTQPGPAAAFRALPIKLTTYGDNGYHWQTNTWCQGSPVQGLPVGEQSYPGNPNGTFDDFITLFVQPDGLDPMIHVPITTNPACNGRADPSEAAAWVDYSNNTKHYGVKYWQLGLYPYADDNGDFGSPPYLANSPSTYVSIANTFAAAMKAKDGTIKVGVALNPTIGQLQSSSWDTTVVTANVDFLTMYYAATNNDYAANPSDTDLLYSSAPNLRATMINVKNELAAAGKPALPVFIDVLDGNDQQAGTQQTNSITTALYYGMALSEVANAGYAAIAEAYGSCFTPLTSVPNEYGSTAFAAAYLIANGQNCPIPDQTILPQGRAYQLAAQFALPNEHMLSASVAAASLPNVRAYAATQGTGYALFLFNLDQNNAASPSINIANAGKATYSATETTYGKAQYDAGVTATPVSSALGNLGANFSVTLPPWSMTVVQLK